MQNTALTGSFCLNKEVASPRDPSAAKEVYRCAHLSQNDSASDKDFINTPTLTLQLSDARYRALVQRAMKEGCTVEMLVARCIHTLLGE